MATVRKVLGQLAPSGLSLDTIYTVPSDTEAVVSSITCCNTFTTQDSFSLVVIPAADGSYSAKNTIYSGVNLPPNNTFIATVGITLAAGDFIQVLSVNGNVAFSVFGQEVTA